MSGNTHPKFLPSSRSQIGQPLSHWMRGCTAMKRSYVCLNDLEEKQYCRGRFTHAGRRRALTDYHATLVA
jgi:hypothetical protein